MPFLSLGRGFSDEFMVSDLADAAYAGDLEKVKKLFHASEDSKEDPMALYMALRGRHRDIHSYLIKSGIIIPEIHYSQVLYEDPSYLNSLPERSDLVKIAKAKLASSRLSSGLLTGDLSVKEVKELIKEGADVKEPVLINYALEHHRPIHLATRYPEINVFRLLISEGADLKVLSPDGKNACRMVLENEEMDQEMRKDFIKLFKKLKVTPIPEIGFGDKVRLWRNKNIFSI